MQPTAPFPTSRLPAVFLVVLLLGAAALRLLHFWHYAGHPLVTHPQVDAAFYHLWARDAAQGIELGTRTLWAAPGYPALLTLVYAVCGPSLRAAMLVQHGLGVLVCVLFALLAARLLPSRRAAMAAALIWAVYPLNLYYESLLLPTALIVGLNVLALLALGASGRGRPAKASWRAWPGGC
jgi:hypothetical protein